MLNASALRVGNKFKSCFGQVQTVLSIIDNTRNGEIKVCADCPDNVPHFKSEQHRLMYSHLILCEENGNQYKPCEIEGEPLTEEWLLKFGFEYCYFPAPDSDGVYREKENVNKEYFKHHKLSEEISYYLPYNHFNYHIGSINIKYVHQLQNLFFSITGEELILKN